MIYLYSGTPGSGKSYHATFDIWQKLRRKDKNRVICNYQLSIPSQFPGHFDYWDNSEITIDKLMSYAAEHHRRGIEGQTLLVIDEAQCIFNSRDWNSGGGKVHLALKKSDSRMDWIKFFSQHRHLGYNIILVAQSDKMLDKQIRMLIEYDVKHLKINNGFFAFLPFTCFLAVEKWYGQQMKLSSQVLRYRKKIAHMYDSYVLFDNLADGNIASSTEAEPAQDAEQGGPRQRWEPAPASAGSRLSAMAAALSPAKLQSDIAVTQTDLTGVAQASNNVLHQGV